MIKKLATENTEFENQSPKFLYISNFNATAVLAFFVCVFYANSFAQDFKTIHPGVEYAPVDHKLGGDPVKINLLRLDLTKVRLDVHHALDAAIGTEKTSSIATRHGAVAAINAGFFRLDNTIFAGDAAGALRIDEKLLSESANNRVVLKVRNLQESTMVDISHFSVSTILRIGKTMIDVDGINRERKEDELVLYTPEFGPTTLTTANGAEVILRNDRIVSLKKNSGSTPIPDDGYIVSIGPKWERNWESMYSYSLNAFRPGRRIRYVDLENWETPPKSFFAEDIVAGVPQLIKDGKVDITWEEEKASKAFVETRHPRTAVAKLKDGKFLMLTVDGRQPGVSVGMSLYELADYLLSIGAMDAMNLDGGGSTTMFLDGKIINTPSDKEGERKVGDVILVTLRKNARR